MLRVIKHLIKSNHCFKVSFKGWTWREFKDERKQWIEESFLMARDDKLKAKKKK